MESADSLPPYNAPEPGADVDLGLFQLPWAFARVGWLLCLAALAAAILGLLPPAPAAPDWWRRCIAVLVAQAPLGLLGLSLVHLAVLLDPQDRRLRRRLQRLRSGAAVASLVLLLLIPLQLILLAGGTALSPVVRSQADAQIERRYAALRSAVLSAGSVPELRERLRLLQGPPLAPQADTLPLALVRQRLLQALGTSLPFVQERLTADLGERALARQGLEALRSILPALLLAIAFASLSPLARASFAGALWPAARPPQRSSLHDTMLRNEVEAYLDSGPVGASATPPDPAIGADPPAAGG